MCPQFSLEAQENLSDKGKLMLLLLQQEVAIETNASQL
jgi:hypothetical protein